MKNIAILLASGTGSRCGLDYPKQFAIVNGKSILEHSVEVFENNKLIDEIIIVTSQEYIDKVKNLVKSYKKVSKVVVGGATRKDSSYNGISVIAENEANILIHDAVRPLIGNKTISDCISSLDNYNAVCVTVPSSDTIFVIDDNSNISNIPKRNTLRRAQTPQCFKLSLIRAAHQRAAIDLNCSVTDDCGLIMNYTDSKIHIVDGSEDNIKVTYKDDIDFVKSKLNKKIPD